MGYIQQSKINQLTKTLINLINMKQTKNYLLPALLIPLFAALVASGAFSGAKAFGSEMDTIKPVKDTVIVLTKPY